MPRGNGKPVANKAFSEKADAKLDKKMGIKEGSKKDLAMDKKLAKRGK